MNAESDCRVLVGGFGKPGMRDLDFGRQVVDCLQQLAWPDGVVVEDLSYAAPLVLHRLQELRPAKVVLLGAVPRGLDAPATLRRYRFDGGATPPGLDVHRSLEESVMGMVDIDHTLTVARHWGGLPADTVVIEVEPADGAFGLGFSDDLASCFDPILDMVREELVDLDRGTGTRRDLRPDDLLAHGDTGVSGAADDVREPSEAMTRLLGYARHHSESRLQSQRPAARIEGVTSGGTGVALAGRLRPWGVFTESGGDWFDAVPLPGGGLGIVVGNVAGRGVDVAAAMSDLRAAARAYVVLDAGSPSRVVGHLDRLAEATDVGRGARILYLILEPATGEVRFTNAGGCPPLVLDGSGSPRDFAVDGRSGPLGLAVGVDRPEGTLRLPAGWTLLLFTDGLVENRTLSRDAGMERLRRAAAEGPRGLDDLCDHVLAACTGDLRRDDDICLLGVRPVAEAVTAHARPEGRSLP